MNRVIRFVIAALTLLLITFLPPAGLIWLWDRSDSSTPTWLLELVTLSSSLIAFEAASRIGPKPFTTPLVGARQRYPTRRDRLVLLSAVLIGVLIFTYGLDLSYETPGLVKMFFCFLSYLTGVVICVLFGSSVLRDDATPSFVKRRRRR